MNKVVEKDLLNIYNGINENEKNEFNDSIIVITGCGGFLGFYLTNFFVEYAKKLNIKRVIGIDNFKISKPEWIEKLKSNDIFDIYEKDIVNLDMNEISLAKEVTHIYHMASIASPTFYRMYPLETVDANVGGLRNLLNYYKENKNLKKFIYFSSSEIYGEPLPHDIPTAETCNGNVSCVGPRACYDESKRFCEMLCDIYSKKFNIPVRVIRPFNNYGPGLNIEDKRVAADFAKAVINNKDIIIHSDGTPTRTFCYISDAITGYLKVTAYKEFDVFNIGMDKPEVSMLEVAEIFKKIGEEYFGYTGKIIIQSSDEKDYLTNNPNRRCPDISKANNLLGFRPKIELKNGIKSYLEFLKEE